VPTGALVEHGLLDHLVRPQQECLRIVSPSALAVFRLMTSSSADWVAKVRMRSITSDVNSPVALRRPYFVFALHTGVRWSKQMGCGGSKRTSCPRW
jgi:hypothetical protein